LPGHVISHDAIEREEKMSENLTDGNWCDEMQCHVTHSYFSGRVAAYQLAYLNAPDMRGTVKSAIERQPQTEKIYVFAPGKSPVIYAKSGVKWHSIQGT
jgi:hypothetical protein